MSFKLETDESILVTRKLPRGRLALLTRLGGAVEEGSGGLAARSSTHCGGEFITSKRNQKKRKKKKKAKTRKENDLGANADEKRIRDVKRAYKHRQRRHTGRLCRSVVLRDDLAQQFASQDAHARRAHLLVDEAGARNADDDIHRIARQVNQKKVGSRAYIYISVPICSCLLAGAEPCGFPHDLAPAIHRSRRNQMKREREREPFAYLESFSDFNSPPTSSPPIPQTVDARCSRIEKRVT